MSSKTGPVKPAVSAEIVDEMTRIAPNCDPAAMIACFTANAALSIQDKAVACKDAIEKFKAECALRRMLYGNDTKGKGFY